MSDDATPREPAVEAEAPSPQPGGGDARAGDTRAGDTSAGDAGADDARAGDAGADDARAGDAPEAEATERPGSAAVDDAGAEATSSPATGDSDQAGTEGGGDGGYDDPELQAAADALEVDLELLVSERAQYLDAYRRAQADFENYRKQAQRRQEDAVVRALGRFVEGLLPVLDSCDAALAHGANEVEPVLTALYGALSKEGLERIDPKGAAFDPTEAEAVVHEPGEGGEQVVAEVLRPGYRWRGQVLRPAMVKVTD
ncbi:MAG TPA: nucleotide exchange factor GrpE [Acidimicrobiales bacterium]